jgi:hypothetical protein
MQGKRLLKTLILALTFRLTHFDAVHGASDVYPPLSCLFGTGVIMRDRIVEDYHRYNSYGFRRRNAPICHARRVGRLCTRRTYDKPMT